MTHKTEPAFSDTTLKTLQAYNVQVTDDDYDIWREELAEASAESRRLEAEKAKTKQTTEISNSQGRTFIASPADDPSNNKTRILSSDYDYDGMIHNYLVSKNIDLSVIEFLQIINKSQPVNDYFTAYKFWSLSDHEKEKFLWKHELIDDPERATFERLTIDIFLILLENTTVVHVGSTRDVSPEESGIATDKILNLLKRQNKCYVHLSKNQINAILDEAHSSKIVNYTFKNNKHQWYLNSYAVCCALNDNLDTLKNMKSVNDLPGNFRKTWIKYNAHPSFESGMFRRENVLLSAKKVKNFSDSDEMYAEVAKTVQVQTSESPIDAGTVDKVTEPTTQQNNSQDSQDFDVNAKLVLENSLDKSGNSWKDVVIKYLKYATIVLEDTLDIAKLSLYYIIVLGLLGLLAGKLAGVIALLAVPAFQVCGVIASSVVFKHLFLGWRSIEYLDILK